MKRLNAGGRVNRSKPIKIRFGSHHVSGFEGDSLASALLASGHSLVGRSFKYHRPRGIYSAGVEEPNALVHLRDGARHEPNAQATQVEAFDGLISTHQNAWPTLNFDIGAVNDLLSPILSAGFYYKTFIGPFKGTRLWMLCETVIRHAAGMGRAHHRKDPDDYEKRHATCDVLIIGGGAAGLSAALAAGRSGAKVILAEQDYVLGGALLSEPMNGEAENYLSEMLAELSTLSNVRILTRTTVFGAYDGDSYGLIERVSDHLPTSPKGQVRMRYWQIHAARSVVASGAIERPLVFGNNDRPGVMLAGAVRTYLNRYAVLAGKRVVICTNNDSVYKLAAELNEAGADVLIADLRPVISPVAHALPRGVRVLVGHGILQAKGRRSVTGAIIIPVDDQGSATGSGKNYPADLIAVSGGWSPTVHLWSQLYRKPQYKADGDCFVPAAKAEHNMQAAGMVNGTKDWTAAIKQGFKAGQHAAVETNHDGNSGEMPILNLPDNSWHPDNNPIWRISDATGKCRGKAFIDFQHDVKVTDIDQAHLEGYVSVEHLKRYTTTGMAADQGKLSNINALKRMAELRGTVMPEVGTTTFRPPYTPVTIGALVGHEHGRHFRPIRRTALHHWHLENGAQMTEAGLWMRPWFYDKKEKLSQAYKREAAHVRSKAGIIDVSTLGKIAVQGPDSATFLDRIYANNWQSLAVGRIRYGVMLREDGMVLDDGTTARLSECEYFMTTTTANAARILAFAEKMLQTDWRDLKVLVTSVTDQWAAFAIAGPNARALLQDATEGVDLSAEGLPNNYLTNAVIAGVDVRLHRMSYSGELAYEVYMPAGFALRVWLAISEVGQSHGLQPYGTEAMGALRIEKGHVAGPEIDGRTTMGDLGLGSFASKKKPFVGSVLSQRPLLSEDERPSLVGFEIVGNVGAKAGALLFAEGTQTSGQGEGWVSSTTYAPALECYIALGFLKNGRARMGETVKVVSFVDGLNLTARVVSHHFFDPKGERQNA